MAYGNKYDVRKYNWQVRELEDNGIMIRYDSLSIGSNNKGRYNTSQIVAVKSEGDTITATTKSGSVYYFSISKCAYPMHLLALTMKFGVEF